MSKILAHKLKYMGTFFTPLLRAHDNITTQYHCVKLYLKKETGDRRQETGEDKFLWHVVKP